MPQSLSIYNLQWYILTFMLCATQISFHSLALQNIKASENEVQEAKSMNYNVWTSPAIFSKSSPRRQLSGSTDPDKFSLYATSPEDIFQQSRGHTSKKLVETILHCRERFAVKGPRNNPEGIDSRTDEPNHATSWSKSSERYIEEPGNSRVNDRSASSSQSSGPTTHAQFYTDPNQVQDFKSVFLRNPPDLTKINSERLIKDNNSKDKVTNTMSYDSERSGSHSLQEPQKLSTKIVTVSHSEELKSQAFQLHHSKPLKNEIKETLMSKSGGPLNKDKEIKSSKVIEISSTSTDDPKGKSLDEEQWKVVKGKGKGKGKLSKNHNQALLSGDADELKAGNQAGEIPWESLKFEALNSDSKESKNIHEKTVQEAQEHSYIRNDSSEGSGRSSNELASASKSHGETFVEDNKGGETHVSVHDISPSAVDQVSSTRIFPGDVFQPTKKHPSQMQQKGRKKKGGQRLRSTSRVKNTDLSDEPKEVEALNIPSKEHKQKETREKESYTGLSFDEFFKVVFQEERKEIGVDIIADDSTFRYLDSIKKDNADMLKKAYEKAQLAIWKFDEGCMRTTSFSKMYEEYIIQRRWRTYEGRLHDDIKKVCKILRADEKWPLYEQATESDWKELSVALSTVKEEEYKYKQLCWLFSGYLWNRVATFHLSVNKAYQNSNIMQRVLQDGAIEKGASLPVLACISDVLELGSERVFWETLSQDDINKKALMLINIMKGEFTLPDGQTLHIFHHGWNSEYTRYYLACPTKFLCKIFNSRLRQLAVLANRGGSYDHVDKSSSDVPEKLSDSAVPEIKSGNDIPEDKRGSDVPEKKSDKAQDIDDVKITPGEALVSIHVALEIEKLKELKSVFKSQKGKGRYFGIWNPEVSLDLMSKAVSFKQFFDFFDHKVLGFKKFMEQYKASFSTKEKSVITERGF
ncbi:uncharacterized protein MELLADRAFT_103586 [Melampsora larici-populina 98AG31]|uniref:Uncharacterized protein n=1 Tax=Melampsora larici-populina (strain 98AG31 / pathotype 3-4-7) TaxID=747676 RepID=F4RBU1_MELLP|nr:uncharacterized protein MELLADRAFT_103586 [Melampsora larici-populina 98AG31]EGG10165.1 hypothetical protein MELLADRAFT_103586 [Melampsora larici-populina 98AG31]